ncbi:unnamed protein product [Caenorhabditis bovis]|uniref:Uncharacterized protein n=1 Tax=Caenorhabditis bovis TaxID=2654633 RepID=A0A8S1EIW8_9PELO|nr:unnamed protein product [Caenorhabditis bovis]
MDRILIDDELRDEIRSITQFAFDAFLFFEHMVSPYEVENEPSPYLVAIRSLTLSFLVMIYNRTFSGYIEPVMNSERLEEIRHSYELYREQISYFADLALWEIPLDF